MAYMEHSLGRCDSLSLVRMNTGFLGWLKAVMIAKSRHHAYN